MNELIHIDHDLYIISGTPFLLVRSIDSIYLVLGDLHFGQEEMITNIDSSTVGYTSEKLISQIVRCVNHYNVDVLILNGDIKHISNGYSNQEQYEVNALLDHPTLEKTKVIIVKGNHDLYIHEILKSKSDLSVMNSYHINKHGNNILIAHGHQKIEYNKQEILILSHEHPSYIMRGSNFEKVKLAAFIICYTTTDQLIVILPASNIISSGISYPIQKSQFLSPILRELEYKSMQIFPFDSDLGVLPLPMIEYNGY